MSKKLSVKYRRTPALILNRVAFRDQKLTYIGRANKKIPYSYGKSRIAYIGTTQNGAGRIASSAVWKGADLLAEHGIKHLEFFVVVCGRLQAVETWKKLERALIIRFREIYGSPPKANSTGNKMRWRDERKYFTYKKLDKIIDQLG